MFRLVVLATLGCLTLLTPGNACANPGQETPEAPLDAHGLVPVDQLHKQTQGLLERCAKTIPNLAPESGKLPSQLMREQWIAVRQLHRLALDLQMCGETAGYDFALRAAALDAQLKDAVGKFKATPVGQAQAAKDRQFLAAPGTAQVRNNAVERIKQFARQQKWSEGYATLYDVTDKLCAYTMFLTPEEERQQWVPFIDVVSPVTVARNKLFREQAHAVLDQALTAQLPNLQTLPAAITAAATGLRTAPSVTLDGRPHTGPQCLESFGKTWRQTQLAVLRCRAIEWAQLVVIPELSYSTPPARPRRTPDADYGRFADEMPKALANLIEADAARAAGPEAATLYTTYLQVAAPLVCSAADDKLLRTLAGALDKLAAKTPTFAADVAAYRAATEECLRWRERTAKSAASARQANFLQTAELLRQATVSREKFRGLLDPNEPKLSVAKLLGPCAEVLPGAAPKAVSQKVQVLKAAGLPGGKLCVSRYAERHYVMFPRPDFTSQIQQLKQDLLVSEQAPPLTLEVAAAIASAESGECLMVGGEVNGVYLEGLIPRFAKLPDTAASLFALGVIPAEPPAEQLLSHVLVRLNVTPTWVNQRYFFAELKPAAPASTN